MGSESALWLCAARSSCDCTLCAVVVGHVGWARRAIGVGDIELVIAGVGEVLISEQVRGQHLGIG